MPDSHQEGGRSTKGTFYLLKDRRYIPCILYMSHSERVTYLWFISPCHRYGTDDSDTSARLTSRTYPDRLHPQTLLLGPPVLRALPGRKTGSRITPDINTERIEPARFGPLGRLWPDATSISRRCFVLRQFLLRYQAQLV